MKKEIRIGTRTISETSPVFVVAEISGNHNQDYGRRMANSGPKAPVMRS